VDNEANIGASSFRFTAENERKRKLAVGVEGGGDATTMITTV